MNNNNFTENSEMDKRLPFSVPENYFEDFAKQIERKTGEPQAFRMKKRKSWLYAAAVFVGLVVIGGAYYSKTQEQHTDSYSDNYESYVLSQVDETSMMDYYVNYK